MSNESKPVDFKGAVNKFENMRDPDMPHIPETKQSFQRLRRIGAVAAVGAELFVGSHAIGEAIDQNDKERRLENGNTPGLVNDQIENNAATSAASSGETPAPAPQPTEITNPYAELQQGIEAQAANNAAQTAWANGENPADVIAK